MLYRCRLVFVVALLLCLGVQLSVSQHWSHGWYPGGKREIDSYSSPEVSPHITPHQKYSDRSLHYVHQLMSGEIKLCEAGECSYLRPLRTNILKSILLDALMRELQKRK
ncbi:hypothetical protein NFI96_028877 [Prochilodus magdalenae]|nr:hypothetical protein NFI96_028877 [Prochilodus magdalenae]